ncbi:type IV pili twitching motility protein PilT [Candidatus Roizmanbacteria bacterium CG22_combo_CG10-13_8_21_14_all_35_9]|uniref:Type IV pili twitching motility protein PilT n=4 Tax=Candidatus Roizmaniibacteriota TaxID=1752723 RepID=A0A2M8F2I3_9BACT|nr:MAG: type IV pili twitching motility protein PilT [Candidatus Roizmanbacteria bacterium CG23_combo_of_CG06-09_8_20_14_all_35_49]PIP62521.1 MAG: type IV pili twitching motility protein PilT [Candidatus Roizmanbacteria bacterium CG22_combo_CG10-13_8_21_14_all_35_9]PIY70689.1 MAG: type IV pili twitching motility protein PilT [Candidatus Roizmanbacteria bacterium CG_4_10_14_0_8_um_filter_35_28]PJC33489.1 MAG: type IV pili twitching motility protein PilT [Candidatus Roizmanbacteria bacterium CG_4_
MDLNKLFQLVIDKNASDLHLIPGYYPTIRVGGEIYSLTTLSIIDPDLTQQMVFSILSEEQKENLLANREIDFAYSYNNNRFRINAYFAQGGICASFRLIISKIRTLEDLLIPAFIRQVVDYRQGLVLLTGPTGEGKSTTLAALINEINNKYAKHILTVEDPIEYIYPKSKSIVSQRELHQDTHSWTVALKSALREDPDVILVGEMRDYDTISLVLTAAETGHLVFSTLHTNSAPESIDRIIDVFSPHQQNQVKNQLSIVLKMIVSQRLLPKNNSTDRVPAVEILVNSGAVAATIREGKTYLIDNILETSEKDGCLLFEKHLVSLYHAGLISKETAFSYAIRPKELENFIKKGKI